MRPCPCARSSRFFCPNLKSTTTYQPTSPSLQNRVQHSPILYLCSSKRGRWSDVKRRGRKISTLDAIWAGRPMSCSPSTFPAPSACCAAGVTAAAASIESVRAATVSSPASYGRQRTTNLPRQLRRGSCKWRRRGAAHGVACADSGGGSSSGAARDGRRRGDGREQSSRKKYHRRGRENEEKEGRRWQGGSGRG